MSLDIYLTAQVCEVQRVHDANITHNVTPMWHEAGIYDALYRSAGLKASDVLPRLKAGLADMRADPEKYAALNPPNGWGTYPQAIVWLAELVAAFEAHPDGIIEVWA